MPAAVISCCPRFLKSIDDSSIEGKLKKLVSRAREQQATEQVAAQ
jgi:hypothetical protein